MYSYDQTSAGLPIILHCIRCDSLWRFAPSLMHLSQCSLTFRARHLIYKLVI